jgi:hypothetical protein
MILSDTAFRLALMRDLRTAPPDTSMCNAAADEIEDMMAEIERLGDDYEDLRVMITAMIKIQEEAGNALDAMTCAGKVK